MHQETMYAFGFMNHEKPWDVNRDPVGESSLKTETLKRERPARAPNCYFLNENLMKKERKSVSRQSEPQKAPGNHKSIWIPELWKTIRLHQDLVGELNRARHSKGAASKSLRLLIIWQPSDS